MLYSILLLNLEYCAFENNHNMIRIGVYKAGYAYVYYEHVTRMVSPEYAYQNNKTNKKKTKQ